MKIIKINTQITFTLLTLIHWQGGKPLVWDATVVTPLASSYVDRAATGAGVVSDLAANRKLD